MFNPFGDILLTNSMVSMPTQFNHFITIHTGEVMKDKIAIEIISKVYNSYMNWITSPSTETSERYITKFSGIERAIIMLKSECYKLREELVDLRNIRNSLNSYDCRYLSLYQIIKLKLTTK